MGSLPEWRRTAAILVTVLLAAGCVGARKSVAIEQDQDLYGLHRGIGMTLLRTDQAAQALPHFRRLERMRPESPEPYYLMARVYMALRLPDLTEELLGQALAADSSYAAAHALLGLVLDSTGRHERAFESHERATDLAPRHGPYLNNMGFNLFIRNRLDEAVEAYRRALAFDPTSRRTHNNMGFAYGRMGEPARAWEHFLRGGSIAVAKNNLGLVREGHGDLDGAYELFLAALENDPLLESARANAARMREALEREHASPQGGEKR